MQSIEGLKRTERLSKRELCLLPAELSHGSSPVFGLKQKHQLILCLKPDSFWTNAYTISAHGSQAFELG